MLLNVLFSDAFLSPFYVICSYVELLFLVVSIYFIVDPQDVIM